MLQRLAFIKLQNELRGGDDAARLRWRNGVEELCFGETLLPNSGLLPTPGKLSEEFVDALNQLAIEPVLGEPQSDEVAPIEKLDVLIRLVRGKADAFNPKEKAAINAVAQSLIDPDFRADDNQIPKLLNAINQVPEGRQAIQIQDLEGTNEVEWTRGPRAPRMESPGTVMDLLGQPDGLKLVKVLLDHPVIVVDACIYKAMVGDNAEYPVHLRTTLSWEQSKLDVGDFDPVLEPQEWPTFNSFWAAMNLVVKPPGAGLPGQPLTTEEQVIKSAGAYVAHIQGIGWESLGSFHERVGFDDGALGGGGAAKPRDLYPDTYLYFSRDTRANLRRLMTYTLLPRQGAPLGVDDGCIEIEQVGTRVDVVTTKSLYVSGMGPQTELAGILAYLAAHCGWGASTLSLVSNAVMSKY